MTLRSNLATRPFYNERVVQLVLAVAAAVVLLATIFNVVRVAALTRAQSRLSAEIAQAEQRSRELRQEASRVRASVDAGELAAVAAAAREANRIIDGRTFSWTDLFNRLEATVPPGVRITGVRPGTDSDGRLTVTLAVVSRDVGDVDQFIEALERDGGFHGVLALQERQTEGGEFETTLEGRYVPAPAGPAVVAEPGAEPADTPEAPQ